MKQKSLKRAAFTLVELLISIALMSIIILLLYQSLNQTKLSNQKFSEFYERQNRYTKLIDLIKRDFLEADEKSIKIVRGREKEFDTIKLKTQNSIKGIFNPYVLYYVAREDDSLIRAESTRSINPGMVGLDTPFKATLIEKNVLKFRVFKDKKRYLFYIEFKDKKPIVFNIELL